MSRVRGAIVLIVALIGVLALTGITIARNWTASIPADAAASPIARTGLDPGVSTDIVLGAEDTSPGSWIVATACLDRLQRPAGAMDLCWSVMREADADPAKDYYSFRLSGSVLGSAGTGTRWAVIRAHFLGQVLDENFMTWPVGQYDGACGEEVATQFPDAGAPETECGRTVGTSDFGNLSNSARWLCVGCVIPDHGSVPIALHQEVGVPQGKVPNWEIFGDLGD